MIVFRNHGTIDPASITTFGVSSKENAGAIGFFGTGLKYAIAILLREGCSISIQTGGEVLTFGTERARIRVDEFTFITMNGERLGFTTELGKTWELWAAFRELYCNCVDEHGEVSELDPGDPEPAAGVDETIITVKGEAFRDVWARRSEIFLDTKPLYRHEAVHIHPGPSEFVFYRGIKAYRPSQPTRYTYNIQRKIDLTEDRTVKYAFEVDNAINRGVLECDQESLIHNILTAPQGTFEAQHTWAGVVPSETVLGLVRRLSRDFNPMLNRTALETCRPWLLGELHNAKPMELSPLEQARLAKAIAFCETVGFNVAEYPIVVTEFLGEGVLGQSHESRIFISKRTFMMGTKMLAGTLIEEFLHLRHRLYDESRGMQNFLMDAIVSLGEQITGEPL